MDGPLAVRGGLLNQAFWTYLDAEQLADSLSVTKKTVARAIKELADNADPRWNLLIRHSGKRFRAVNVFELNLKAIESLLASPGRRRPLERRINERVDVILAEGARL